MVDIKKEKFKIIGNKTIVSQVVQGEHRTYFMLCVHRIKNNKSAMISLFVLIIVSVMCMIGPSLTPYKFMVNDSSSLNMAPSFNHYFGTDELGRDIFSRVWIGGRVSLTIGLLGALVDTVLGVVYGGISGYFGGLVDDIMMRIAEVLSSIPYLIVVILISLLVGRGIFALVIAMTITGWVTMARLVRGQVLKLKEQDYVLAARALGAGPFRIIARHIIPNTIGIIIVAVTFDIPVFIFGEAFLSFIGLGVQSPNTSWGSLTAAAQQNLMFYPYQIFFPALFISITMLCFNLLGDGLRDAIDPRINGVGRS
ncbi:MAG: ABC transporter permease [Solirubrobacterales bacterium]